MKTLCAVSLVAVSLVASFGTLSFAQTRYGETKSEDKSSSVGNRYGGSPAKKRPRLSANQSVDLALCNQSRANCLCPQGYLKIEGQESQATGPKSTSPVVEVNRLKVRRVVRCVKPCSDGRAPSAILGSDGKMKNTCAGIQ